MGFRRYLRSSGFEYEADKIRHQLKHQGFCTKSQFEFLMLYAEYEQDAGQALRMKDVDLKNIKILKDKDEQKTDMALAQINQLVRALRSDYRHQDGDKNLSRNLTDKLKKMDLSKLEAKDFTLENISKITGIPVDKLRSDVPNRRFKEFANSTLARKLRENAGSSFIRTTY